MAEYVVSIRSTRGSITMICTLCLRDIVDGEETTQVDDRFRHIKCSEKLEEMILDLDRIYQDTEAGED